MMKTIFLFILLLPTITYAQQAPSEGYIGAPVPQYGQQCAAQDPSGNLKALTVDSSGNLKINGTIVATNPSVGPNNTPIPTNSTLVGGSDGTNLRPLSVNASGVLALPQGASTAANQSTEITALGTINTTLGSPFQAGGSIGNTAFGATQSGTWNVGLNAGSNAIGSITNTTFGSTQSGTWTTGRTWSLSNSTDSVNVGNFPASQTVSGTVAATQSGTWNVGLSAGTNAIGSITNTSFGATQSGTWTVQPGNTANTTPWLFSLSQGGNTAAVTASSALKVDGSAVTQPVSATSLPLPTGAATSANQSTEITSLATIATNTGNIPAGLTVTSNNLQVLQPDTTTTGAITSTQTVQLNVSGLATVGFGISGTWTGTVTIEGTVDGTNWYINPSVALASGGSSANYSSNNAGQISVGGLSAIRIRGNTVTSGTANISLRGNAGASVVMLDSSLPAGSNNIGSIGSITGSISLPTGASSSANQTNGTQKTQIVDGSGNVIASTNNALNVQDQAFANPPGVNANPTAVLNMPGSNSLAALSASAAYQVQPGSTYLLSVTNPAGATSLFSGTVSFATSPNGTTYTSVNCLPLNSYTAQVASSTVAPGLFLCAVPQSTTTTNYLRAQMTAYTSGTAVIDVAPYGQYNTSILLPWTYTVTSGNTLMGPIDAAGMSEIDIQISAITTTVITAQGTNDPSLTTWDTLPVQDQKVQGTGSLTMAAASTYRVMPSGFKYVRFQVTTTGTVLTVQGIVAHYGQTLALNAYGQGITANIGGGTLPTVTTVSTVSTVSSVTSSNEAIPGIIADVASAAITSTTTTAAFTPTYGNSYLIDIPVTAVSGTTPTMSVAVQESQDSGTNWVTVYTFPTITTTGSYYSPPLYFKGNRVRYVQTIGGTTPSFTRAINRLQMSGIAAMPVNNNATFASAAVSAVTTLTAPQNAVGFVLQNLNTNSTNLRYVINGTASASNGMQLEPGRDTGEIHAGQNISICPESGTITYSIQWIQQQV